MSCPIMTNVDTTPCQPVAAVSDECYPQDNNNITQYYYNDPITYNESDQIQYNGG